MNTFTENMILINDFVPELSDVLHRRYKILYLIKYLQPIGRRALSVKMHLTERIIRREAMILKDSNYLEFTSAGMSITTRGEAILYALSAYIEYADGIQALEIKLADKLGIARLILVPDDDDKRLVLKEIGQRCKELLKTILPQTKVLGITGGTTMHEITKSFKSEEQVFNKLHIVPARGGLGSDSRHQANTLAESLARKLKSQYSTLFIPDSLSFDAIEQLKKEKHVKASFDKIQQIDTLVFGVGLAGVLAKRRGLSDKRISEIVSKGAVAEAFGYYFNKDGQIVDEISTLGISLEKVKSLTSVIAVAGGKDKADAIIAVSKINPQLIVITNESAAIRIGELLGKKN